MALIGYGLVKDKIPLPGIKPQSGKVTIPEIYTYVSRYQNNMKNGPVDPKLIAAMAMQESSLNPNASRFEAHIRSDLSAYPSGDTSLGLMQVLTSTAKDMNRKGYSRYPATITALRKPDISVYFGMAYIDWLKTWGKSKGIAPTMNNIIEWYNGGPGNSNAMTKRHLNKVLNNYRSL